jgi:hypothetical protein
MTQSRNDGQFEVKPMPIIGQFNRQRFKQFSPEDVANWFVIKGNDTKRQFAMLPTMGRAHIRTSNFNRLIFGAQPRAIFKSISYLYVVVGDEIIRIDNQWNQVPITSVGNLLATSSGPVYFTFLVVNDIVFSCFVDSLKIYVYQENTGVFSRITDPNAPGNIVNADGTVALPGYIATFGNRITVSVANSSQFFLSEINLLTSNVAAGQSAQFQPLYAFTVGTVLNYTPPAAPVVSVAGAAVFAQEEGIIRQMGVLNNTLYIFTDYTTGIWSNIPAVFSGTGVSFPWKKNTTYNWNFGIANPNSLDIDFGLITFLGRNSDGLLQFMQSTGDQPKPFNDNAKAISSLLQRYVNLYGNANPFLSLNTYGFLFMYEDTISYRIGVGLYDGSQILDQTIANDCFEFSFETDTWHRCLELNGERNRIQQHVYFNNNHLVIVIGENTVYSMSGQFYTNEVRNPAQSNAQASDAYLVYPFRYERITPIISEPDYAEFETEYVEIDFVWGESNINFSTQPFSNTLFIIDEVPAADGSPQYMIAEQPGVDGQPVFMIADGTNTPSISDNTYNTLFKPSIELFYSDDGGVSYNSADIRQFSQMGVYIWKMRWYQLGPSRNRVYKLVCVSPVPIVILGAVMNVRRISGGAN